MAIAYDEVWENRHNNKGKCVECGKKLVGRQQLYCSGKCESIFYNKHVKVWSIFREKIFRRDNYICQECGIIVHLGSNPLETRAECDHILAISLGGSFWDEDNLRTLCHECHKKKTARDVGPKKNDYKNIHLGIQKTLCV